MNSGEAMWEEILNVMSDEISRFEGPHEVLSIFAGKLYWESLDGFLANEEPEHQMARLLEFRVYGPDGEFHAMRDAIGPECTFSWRTAMDDGKQPGVDYIDDLQRLDIDARASGMLPAGRVRSTGGGEYSLPEPMATRVRLRNYLEYGADGMAAIVDFRLVGLEGDAPKAGGR